MANEHRLSNIRSGARHRLRWRFFLFPKKGMHNHQQTTFWLFVRCRWSHGYRCWTTDAPLRAQAF